LQPATTPPVLSERPHILNICHGAAPPAIASRSGEAGGPLKTQFSPFPLWEFIMEFLGHNTSAEDAETGPGASFPNMGLNVVDDVLGVGAGSENPRDAAGV
jgi:hypothetical protein